MSTHNIQFHDKKKKIRKYMVSGAYGRISQGLKNKFQSAMANKPSRFELLRFDCTQCIQHTECNLYMLQNYILY